MTGSLFFSETENAINHSFLKDGYVVFSLDEQKENIAQLKGNLHKWGAEILGKKLTESEFFDFLHLHLPVEKLNAFRLQLIQKMQQVPTLRRDIYQVGKKWIDFIVGNELAMQRSCNLSIQYPQDNSSLLPLHSDVWSGNSPYEIVFWLPFTDCYKTRSMYILPLEKTTEVINQFEKLKHLTAEELFKKIEKDLVWLDVPYGHGVIFCHGLLHGNVVNKEDKVRWTTNVRFKSLLTPYGTKDIGESFLPITVRPLTRIGHDYQIPGTLK